MRRNEEGGKLGIKRIFVRLQCGKGQQSLGEQQGPWCIFRGLWRLHRWDQLSWRSPECRGCRKFQTYSCSLLDRIPGLGNPSCCLHTVETCWLPGKWGRWRRDPSICREGTVGTKFSKGPYRAVGASYRQSCWKVLPGTSWRLFISLLQSHLYSYSAHHLGFLDWRVGHIAPSHFLRGGSLSFVSSGIESSFYSLFWAGEIVVRCLCYVLSLHIMLLELVLWKIQSNWSHKLSFQDHFYDFQCVQGMFQTQALSFSFC